MEDTPADLIEAAAGALPQIDALTNTLLGASLNEAQAREPANQLNDALAGAEDVAASLGRLNQLSERLRTLRDRAAWQREATTTVAELLAAAADLETLAAERVRLLRVVAAAARKPRRRVPREIVEALPAVEASEEKCPVCRGRRRRIIKDDAFRQRILDARRGAARRFHLVQI